MKREKTFKRQNDAARLAALLLVAIAITCQCAMAHTISGTIYNSNGEIIVGASVIAVCKGDSIAYGSTSDDNGEYKMVIPPTATDSVSVSASCLGYETKEITYTHINGNIEADFVLFPSSIKLGEVTVQGNYTVLNEKALQYYPTKNQAKSSTGITELLSRLAIPNVNIDRMSNSITTYAGEAIIVLIDGHVAAESELRSIRPVDVLRVEYVDNPSGEYANYRAYINIIPKKIEYGGYVYLNANQSFIFNSGNYLASAKLTNKKWTYQVDFFGNFMNTEIESNNTENMTLLNGQDNYNLRKNTISNRKQNYNTLAAGVSIAYADSLNYFYTYISYNRQKMPTAQNSAGIEYDLFPDNKSWSETEDYSSTDVPAISLNYRRTLPRSQSLNLQADFKTMLGDQNKMYNEYGSMANSFEKLVSLKKHILSGNLSYLLPFNAKNSLTVGLSTENSFNKTDYNGTQVYRQNDLYSFSTLWADYSHSFNQKAKLSLSASGFFDLQKIDGKTTRKDFTPTASADLSYGINQRHTLRLSLKAGVIIPGDIRNDIIQPIDGILYNVGNPHVENGNSFSSKITYIGNMGNFSLYASVGQQLATNTFVTAWFPQSNGTLHQTYVNSGNYSDVELMVAPALYLLNRSLIFSGMFSYTYQHKSKLYHRSRNPIKFNLAVAYYIKHFSINAYYMHNGGKTMDVLYGGTDTEKYDMYGIALSYNLGNFTAAAGCANIFGKESTKEWNNAPYYNKYSQRTANYTQQVYLSLSYTFDFGRKVKRTINKYSGSEISTGIM